MSEVAWRVRGRLRGYRHRMDMLRREGELTRLEEALLVLAAASLVGLFCMAMGSVRLQW
jgi:hypothetical protein